MDVEFERVVGKGKRARRILLNTKFKRRHRDWGDRTIKPFRIVANRVERHYVHRHLRVMQTEPDYRHIAITRLDVQWNYD